MSCEISGYISVILAAGCPRLCCSCSVLPIQTAYQALGISKSCWCTLMVATDKEVTEQKMSDDYGYVSQDICCPAM